MRREGSWSSSCLRQPDFAARISMREPRRVAHRDAVAWSRRRHVASAANDNGILEMLVQVIDILDHPALHRTADRDVIEHRQMLDVLAETDAAGVRTHRHAEL